MLSEQVENNNKEALSEELLPNECVKENKPEILVWKRALLLTIGNAFTLSVISLILSLAFKSTAINNDAALTFITYSILFVGLMAVILFDVPKFLSQFKNWKAYVMGAGIGIGIIVFDIIYFNFVNLFYQSSVGGNETGIRSIIALYPVASILIFGFIGPACEELTYRVGLFGLCKKLNIVFAYIITGLVFGLIHFDFQSADLINELICLPTYIVPGVLFALCYDKFGFACSYVAHVTNNLWAVISQIIVLNS